MIMNADNTANNNDNNDNNTTNNDLCYFVRSKGIQPKRSYWAIESLF